MLKLLLSFILACTCFFLFFGQAQTKPPASQIGANAKRDGDALYSEVKELNFEELRTELAAMPGGSERDFFAGILANRDGQID